MGVRQKVFIGMSGGVDSAVSALLLQQAGFDVTGVFMKNWSDSVDEMGRCSWRAERRDALRVAAFLGIPFLTLDFEKEYRERVGEYLFREYAAGRTPNPDIVCNRDIKIPLFWREARKLGADYIATGHYARKMLNAKCQMPKPALADGAWELLMAEDKNKDQSYFLYTLTQDYLAHLLFPIGDLQKSEVRDIARERGLSVAEKKDSTGICFIGEVDLKEFLAQRLPKKRGNIVDAAGNILGEHDGVWFFTIGQRKGIEVGGAGLPYYVARKDVVANTIVVAHEHDAHLLYAQEADVADLHWISGQPPHSPFACEVKIRYRQDGQAATVANIGKGSWKISFDRPQRAVTPGQSAVFYQDAVCLGGGIIQ